MTVEHDSFRQVYPTEITSSNVVGGSVGSYSGRAPLRIPSTVVGRQATSAPSVLVPWSNSDLSRLGLRSQLTG